MAGDDDRWLRRVERERIARKEAERLLEEKSLALYNANLKLQAFATDLESQVAQRTLELQAALQEAQKATRAKSDFLATMSHEIRTPMNGMLGMADLLRQSVLTDEQRAHVDVIRSSGDALLALINDILDFSKIDAGRLDLEVRPFDLNDEVKSIVALFRPMAEKKGLHLNASIAPELPQYVIGDSNRLRQVFSNLLSNAIKFTASGQIALRLDGRKVDDSKVELDCEVQDSGIGIPADRLDRLFKVFSQVDSSTTREYGGTGLGLAICARLTEAMGGNIEVQSLPGAGSTFRFRAIVGIANAIDRPGVLQDRKATDTTEALPLASLRVLLVEDHVINQVLASKLLERMGITADLATDGAQAVRCVSEVAYDIILMDMQMPVMDGLEATRAIRQLPLPVQPYIIALTANAYDSDRENCLQAGMNDFLSKPFRVENLREKLAVFRRTTVGAQIGLDD